MDKLSEYIPLIVILAFAIISAIGKKKKQGKVTQQTTLPGKTAGEYIDEWILPENPPDSPRRTIEKKPKKQVLFQPEVKMGKDIESFSEKAILVEPEETVGSFVAFEDEEDVKRAIIYTEILRKKEYC